MSFRILLLILLVFISNRTLSAQYEFFWSIHDLHQGATNGDAVVDMFVGDSGSLFLYYSTNGPNDSDNSVGSFIDIATSMNGVIEFTTAETFDFDILMNGVDIDNRWLDEMGGGGSVGHTGTVTDNFIEQWNAFTVTGGTGILEANNGSGALLDTGYDAGADAFLFGRVDFNVVGEGTIDFLVETSPIPPFGGADIFFPELGSLTINANVVPEPGTTILLLASTTGLLARRRLRF